MTPLESHIYIPYPVGQVYVMRHSPAVRKTDTVCSRLGTFLWIASHLWNREAYMCRILAAFCSQDRASPISYHQSPEITRITPPKAFQGSLSIPTSQYSAPTYTWRSADSTKKLIFPSLALSASVYVTESTTISQWRPRNSTSSRATRTSSPKCRPSCPRRLSNCSRKPSIWWKSRARSRRFLRIRRGGLLRRYVLSVVDV
jgi:hypothetical protein